jgi:hypothetical protein
MRRVRAAACRMRIVGPNRHSFIDCTRNLHSAVKLTKRTTTSTFRYSSYYYYSQTSDSSTTRSLPSLPARHRGTGEATRTSLRSTSHRHAALDPSQSSAIPAPQHTLPRVALSHRALPLASASALDSALLLRDDARCRIARWCGRRCACEYVSAATPWGARPMRCCRLAFESAAFVLGSS